MNQPKCIVLVGMPGSGKTTVGRELAKRLGLRFVDSDHEIELRTGVKIPTIFEIEGEDGFRKRETCTLDALTQESGLVLATGGGAVISPVNRQLMSGRGVVFTSTCLPTSFGSAPVTTAAAPVAGSGPAGPPAAASCRSRPLYREVAHIIVEGGRGTPHAMVRMIEKELQTLCEH
jgi:shikimate kinase